MKSIYEKILKKAITHYKKGRAGDVEHITWLVKTVPNFVNPSDIDFDILMPVVLLHDVGYSKVPKGANPFHLDIRKFHSEEGANIAEKILEDVHFPKMKIKEIKRLILKHDNWAFGDDFSDEPVLRIFNNFDFMWMASKKGFDIVRKFTKKTPEEFYKQIQAFQKKNEEDGRVWFNKSIATYYKALMTERKKSLDTII